MSTETIGMETELALPGAQLKKARENANRSLEDVAHEMHMKVWQLDELENDNYDKLAGSVFVQGYIRTYARLLDIDSAPLLEAFASQKVDEPRWEMHPPIEEAPGKSIWLAVFTALVSAGLVAAFVVWLNANGYLGTSFGFQKTETEVASEMLLGTALPVAQLEEKTDGERQLLLPNQTVGEEGTVSEASDTVDVAPENKSVSPSEEPGESKILDAEPAVATSIESQDKVNETTSSIVEAATAVPEEKATDSTPIEKPIEKMAPLRTTPSKSNSVIEAGVGVVSLSCEEDSWVEVRDANGKLLIHGLRKAGFAAEIDGKAPYQVFLGNAPGVTIEVGDDVFDTTPFVRDNRTARFLLLQK